MSALTKAKGFKKSKSGLYVSMATSAFGAVGVYKQIKKARGESDTLRLLDASSPEPPSSPTSPSCTAS